MDNKKIVIVTLGGGTPHRTERRASVRYSLFSDDFRERRSEVRLTESEVSYG